MSPISCSSTRPTVNRSENERHFATSQQCVPSNPSQTSMYTFPVLLSFAFANGSLLTSIGVCLRFALPCLEERKRERKRTLTSLRAHAFYMFGCSLASISSDSQPQEEAMRSGKVQNMTERCAMDDKGSRQSDP